MVDRVLRQKLELHHSLKLWAPGTPTPMNFSLLFRNQHLIILNELWQMKHTEQCLVHSKCLVNISYDTIPNNSFIIIGLSCKLIEVTIFGIFRAFSDCLFETKPGTSILF